MKKNIFHSFSLFWSFLLLALVLPSCNNDEPTPKARILITPESLTIEIGQTARFEYTVDSKIDLKEIKISTENQVLQTITTNFLTSTKHEGEFDLTGKRPDIGKIIEITVESIDICQVS